MSAPNTTYDKFDIGALVYKPPLKNKSGGQNLYIDTNAESRTRPRIQLGNQMRCPFGVRFPQGQESGDRMNLELSVDDASVLAVVDAIDKQNVRVASENVQSWFGKKKLSEDTLGEMYRWSAVRSKTNPDKYAPLLRVKVVLEGKNKTNVYVAYTEDGVEKYREGTVDDIQQGCAITPIVEIAGIWFVSKGFGMSLTASDLLVYQAPASTGFDFHFDGVAPTAGVGKEAGVVDAAAGGGFEPVKAEADAMEVPMDEAV